MMFMLYIRSAKSQQVTVTLLCVTFFPYTYLYTSTALISLAFGGLLPTTYLPTGYSIWSVLASELPTYPYGN